MVAAIVNSALSSVWGACRTPISGVVRGLAMASFWRSTRWAICDILGMSAGECVGHAPTGRACQPAEPLMERLRVTVENATSEDSSHGPVCPHCREPLRSNLRQEQVTPQQATDPGPKR